MKAPHLPKIYHIVHVDRLASIVRKRALWCDKKIQQNPLPGTTIGMSNIKSRRMINSLNSHKSLKVGDCVPFYFCPRSVMLYVLHMGNHRELTYHGGQEPIVHLEGALHEAVDWAENNNLRWAFTLSNAGSSYFLDYCDLSQLEKIDWKAVMARDWRACREQKQAEFLVEKKFPWLLVQRIGVHSESIHRQVIDIIDTADHKPSIQVLKQWYY